MTLHVLHSEPEGDGILDLLEELTAEAKAGKLSSLGVVIVHRDGGTESRWSRPPSHGLLLGAATRLVHRLNLRMDE